LRRTASKEAVCRVFEKVNTGGVALTAFELLTATYAADDFLLREDWYGNPKRTPAMKGRASRMAEAGKVLEVIENTDFLQAVSLLYTLAGKSLTESGRGSFGVPSAISCTRQSILDLPLAGYWPNICRSAACVWCRRSLIRSWWNGKCGWSAGATSSLAIMRTD
jgi:hypothetical protein